MKPDWLRAAEYAGLELDPGQREQMSRFRRWLAEEGIKAGGLGPGEESRLERRHLADSILFASQLDSVDEVWDLGSGVGLPGIPLAISMPSTGFVLVDRSGRRVDLTRRAVRVLGLENCQVVAGEIENLGGPLPALVSRASLPPPQLGEVASRVLAPGGVAVVGGSWREAPRHPGWTTIEIPPDVLDQPIWLLIMRRQ
ncbi:MAG TPA: RsmG family class I SAM-dependent methyltransferase [Acidimicrobiia bacterium]|nr:RsmG family class I SAM-dependent methyltransferase [Acidimicrobiia bacterium]